MIGSSLLLHIVGSFGLAPAFALAASASAPTSPSASASANAVGTLEPSPFVAPVSDQRSSLPRAVRDSLGPLFE